MTHESAIHAVAFAMFNHYHRHLNRYVTEDQVLALWRKTHLREQWYQRAEIACNTYNKWKENNP